MSWLKWLQSRWTVAALVAAVVASLALNVVVLARDSDSDADEISALRAELAASQEETDRIEAATGVLVAQSNALQQGITDALPEVEAAIASVIDELAGFATSTITFPVAVDQDVPVRAALPLNETIEIDLQTSLPINETFETTVRVQTPLGFDIPLDVEIPVQVDVPVDLEVPITVSETFEIDTVIPLQLSVPVTIDISQTDLAGLAAGLEEFLRELQARLAELDL